MSSPVVFAVLLRCPEGDTMEVSPVLFNVDGHAVVPIPAKCPTCQSKTKPQPHKFRPPGPLRTWLELRRARRYLRSL